MTPACSMPPAPDPPPLLDGQGRNAPSRCLARPHHWLVALALGGWVGLACAAGGSGTYPLEWGRPGEVLEYRSCGCADSCWVATVKHRKTRQTLVQLRCDCEKAYATVGPKGREQAFADTCQAFDTPEKPHAIRQTLESLLGR